MEKTVRKPVVNHTYNQKRVIKTDKPKGKQTIITRKPVAEVKIDLSSTQLKLSANNLRASY